MAYWLEDGTQTLTNGNGTLITYHKNNRIASRGQMINGRHEGEWLYWNINGFLIKKGNYSNNIKVGFWLEGDLTGEPYVDVELMKKHYSSVQLEDALQFRKAFISIKSTLYKSGNPSQEYTYYHNRLLFEQITN